PRAAVRLHAHVPVLGHVLSAHRAAAVAAVDRVDLPAVARLRAGARGHLRQARRSGHDRRAQRIPAPADGGRPGPRAAHLHAEAGEMTTSSIGEPVEAAAATRRRGGVRALWAGNPLAVVQRGLIAARSSSWVVVFSGFFEPVFYLLSMGIGLGS